MRAHLNPGKKYKHHCILQYVVLALIFYVYPPSTISAGNKPNEVKKATKDIRIVIDISGSMKKTDPNNLRQPAIKLFSTLLTDEVHASVWTFGKWVNMLVPHGVADKNWKSVAHAEANNINSVGLFTNIEDAIHRSTWDWKNEDPTQERHLVLLSDGMVDVSEDASENDKSRTRILDKTLARLVQAKAIIHTIALSNASDRSLLRQLSSATGGVHETINTTSDLDKVFLRILDASSPREELPLIDNKVKVDKSIKEITFLIFKKNSASKTIIHTPSRKTISSDNHDEGVAWHTENRFDLVTISSPSEGTWSIEADTLPDNRVMVITELRFVPKKLPNIALSDQIIPLHAHLESEDKIIEKREFLHFVRMSAKYRSDDSKIERTARLKDDGIGADKKKRDGLFSGRIARVDNTGRYTIEFIANGTTFKRQRTQQVNIVEYPLLFELLKNSQNNIEISIIPYQSLVDINTININLLHTLPDSTTSKYEITKSSEVEWKKIIESNSEDGKHSFALDFSAKDNKGKKLTYTINLGSIHIEGDNLNNEAKPDVDHDKNNHEHTEEQPTEEEPENWLSIVALVGTFNLFLAGLVFFSFKYREKFVSSILPHPCKES